MSKTQLSGQKQALTFVVAGDEYAVGILGVKEIIEFETPTRVPSAPVCVTGVINLRGTVVPVIDLAVRLGLPAAAVTPRTCIVIVEAVLDSETVVMGIVADSVSQVIDLVPDDIEPPPSFGTHVRPDFLIGMIKCERKFVLLLDVDKTLSALDMTEIAAPPLDVDAEPEAKTEDLVSQP